MNFHIVVGRCKRRGSSNDCVIEKKVATKRSRVFKTIDLEQPQRSFLSVPRIRSFNETRDSFVVVSTARCVFVIGPLRYVYIGDFSFFCLDRITKNKTDNVRFCVVLYVVVKFINSVFRAFKTYFRILGDNAFV